MRFAAVCLKLCVAVVCDEPMLGHVLCLVVRVSEHVFSVGVLGKVFVAAVRVILLTVHTNYFVSGFPDSRRSNDYI
jgi:hypothetical protein